MQDLYTDFFFLFLAKRSKRKSRKKHTQQACVLPLSRQGEKILLVSMVAMCALGLIYLVLLCLCFSLQKEKRERDRSWPGVFPVDTCSFTLPNFMKTIW
jgi:hypothetical protein